MTADLQDAALRAQMAEAFRVDTIRNVVISSQDSSAIRLSPEIKVVIEKGQVCLFSTFHLQ
jgi:hypothetical protein